MKKLQIFLLLMTAIFSTMALSEVAVIVHPSNGATIGKADITALFLGKKKAFPDGSSAVPIILNDATTDEFNSKLLGKSASQLKSYWSKLVFTGKANPPKAVSSDEMVQLIASNPNMIGFIDSSKVTPDVKVISQH